MAAGLFSKEKLKEMKAAYQLAWRRKTGLNFVRNLTREQRQLGGQNGDKDGKSRGGKRGNKEDKSRGGKRGGLASGYGDPSKSNGCEPYPVSLRAFKRMKNTDTPWRAFADLSFPSFELTGPTESGNCGLWLYNPRITKGKSSGTITQVHNSFHQFFLSSFQEIPFDVTTVYNLCLIEFDGMKDTYFCRFDFWLEALVFGHQCRVKSTQDCDFVLLATGMLACKVRPNTSLWSDMDRHPSYFNIIFYLTMVKELLILEPLVNENKITVLAYECQSFLFPHPKWVGRVSTKELEVVSTNRIKNAMIEAEAKAQSALNSLKQHESLYTSFVPILSKFLQDIKLEL